MRLFISLLIVTAFAAAIAWRLGFFARLTHDASAKGSLPLTGDAAVPAADEPATPTKTDG